VGDDAGTVRPALLVLLAAVALLVPATARADLVTRPVGAAPLSDAAAAAKVQRSSFEPRPENAAANALRPTAAQLRSFRARSDMPYKDGVTGRFRGTTDEILQWSAIKWGFDPELFRAVAAVETWWKQGFVGDNGDSYGLMQMRRPYHCCLPFMASSTAFNVDYYGAILRSYYDGRQTWLNTVERGRDYGAGDLWGSVGVWASGRWHLGSSDGYAAKVQDYVGQRVWTGAWF
jgi:hypothetical protein